jgi:carotenoid 1,2-hydratase
MKLAPFDDRPGTYRWYYIDIAGEEFSAVAIFMIGAVFSPSALDAARRGRRPRESSAVNFALYERGKRAAWVFSQYSDARLSERTLDIGGSRLSIEASGLRVEIDEKRAPFGRRLRAELVLDDALKPSPPVQLGALPHYWQVRMPRARAKSCIEGKSRDGVGYHDSNWGDELLGDRLSAWHWQRRHSAASSEAVLHLRSGPRFSVHADDAGTRLGQDEAQQTTRPTFFGLQVPDERAPRIESSPFYARMLAGETMSEVCDFARFNALRFRWMARFRQRLERR